MKRGQTIDSPNEVVKQDLTTHQAYKGRIPSVVGMHRVLVKGVKHTIIFVWAERLEETKEKYGSDFIRDLGEVKSDHRPQAKNQVTYLV